MSGMPRVLVTMKEGIESPIHSAWQKNGEEFSVYELLTWAMCGLEYEIDRATEVLHFPEPREYPATDAEIKALEMRIDRLKRMYFLCHVIKSNMINKKEEYALSIKIPGCGIDNGDWETIIHKSYFNTETNGVEQY